MNEEFIQYVERRLLEWAEWFSRDRDGLGYPTHTMEYLLMKGEIRSEKSPHGYITSNPEAEEIEQLVNEMSEYNYNMAIALRSHYFAKGGSRIKAALVKMPRLLYRGYIDMAHQWLAGRLSAYIKRT